MCARMAVSSGTVWVGVFFFSSRRRHTRSLCDWSSDVCSSDLGAIVRISGSGMGCGDHWPKCYGRWFPPLDRPDLVIEVSHRYLASILLLALIGTLVVAWRRRAEPGVGGRGGVVRMSGLGVALGFAAALLGAVTVKFGNAPYATLGHWTVAMSLVAATVAALVRAGGLGGAAAVGGGVSNRTRRGALV